jgi:hypothetical protein
MDRNRRIRLKRALTPAKAEAFPSARCFAQCLDWLRFPMLARERLYLIEVQRSCQAVYCLFLTWVISISRRVLILRRGNFTTMLISAH